MSKEKLTAKMKPLVLKYHSSRQSRKAFASAHGISEAKLTYWIKKISNGNDKTQKATSPSGFVPVKVQPTSSLTSGHLLIRLPSGVEIQIPI